MKTPLLIIGAVIALLAGISVVHCQAKAETLRASLVRENGLIVNQVQHRLEDKLTSLTEGWLSPGAERRERVESLRADEQIAEWWAIRCAWVNAGALAITALVGIGLSGASRRRVLAAVSVYCWLLGILLPVLNMTVSAATAAFSE